jgi:hypothetical protein
MMEDGAKERPDVTLKIAGVNGCRVAAELAALAAFEEIGRRVAVAVQAGIDRVPVRLRRRAHRLDGFGPGRVQLRAAGAPEMLRRSAPTRKLAGRR